MDEGEEEDDEEEEVEEHEEEPRCVPTVPWCAHVLCIRARTVAKVCGSRKGYTRMFKIGVCVSACTLIKYINFREQVGIGK